jgi:chorismate mutase
VSGQSIVEGIDKTLAKGCLRMIRGIRGATTVEHDDAVEIIEATMELLKQLADDNFVEPESMSSIFFSLTPDLNAAFPAEAARRLGWTYVPVICMRELSVPNALAKAIRVIMMAETQVDQKSVRHVYLRGAEGLRQDLVPITGFAESGTDDDDGV